jgi:hypothetical protein
MSTMYGSSTDNQPELIDKLAHPLMVKAIAYAKVKTDKKCNKVDHIGIVNRSALSVAQTF